jgi:hypothetical protein
MQQKCSIWDDGKLEKKFGAVYHFLAKISLDILSNIYYVSYTGTWKMEDDMENGKFFNFVTGKSSNDAVEKQGDFWYIKMGFAAFNTRANNSFGYKTKKAAEAAILRYQSR